MGIWGAAAPAGGTAGVFLGGVITEWINWRWTFLINVPIGILVLVAIPSLLPRVEGRRGKLDLAGAATGHHGRALDRRLHDRDRQRLRLGVRRAPLGFGILAALLFVSFVVIERRRDEPLVPFAIFRVQNLTAANTVMALLGAAWIPMWFYLNLYLQQVLGYGAFESGAALLPMTIAIMVLMVGVTGRVVARFGFKPPMVAGLVLLAAGIALLARVPVEGSFATNILGASAGRCGGDGDSRSSPSWSPPSPVCNPSRAASRPGMSTPPTRSAPRSVWR